MAGKLAKHCPYMHRTKYQNQKINFLLMDALHNSYRISGRVRRWHMRMYNSFWYYTQCIVGQTKRR